MNRCGPTNLAIYIVQFLCEAWKNPLRNRNEETQSVPIFIEWWNYMVIIKINNWSNTVIMIIIIFKQRLTIVEQ